jgi:hypothetical protein
VPRTRWQKLLGSFIDRFILQSPFILPKSRGNPIKTLHSTHSVSDVTDLSAHVPEGPEFEFWREQLTVLCYSLIKIYKNILLIVLTINCSLLLLKKFGHN